MYRINPLNMLLFTYSTNILVRFLTDKRKNFLTPKNPKMYDPIVVRLNATPL